VKKEGGDYLLCLDERLTERETAHLIKLCSEKLAEYEAKRGDQIWQHRKLSSGYISGTLRYEVLKKAQFHCELCGISADVRALEIDHIVLRNLGGIDDPRSLIRVAPNHSRKNRRCCPCFLRPAPAHIYQAISQLLKKNDFQVTDLLLITSVLPQSPDLPCAKTVPETASS
jgi:hypothetical protein